ncbi:sigma-70 family RNA polymerase sigma factor [Amycolatopsis sp. K13G38]|uniref:Sigma-70 family RNA polymerase sigma factor n=1 Tax=Amycolatopsis acididurans TaxID=2724524 RepID=A0ABX1J725_9PSEU|nr:sigma-70 family RNA polymerase sigma factor [Amycolatopsis acididurans]NKQ54215.1 sigma-70 family RNA polymerase sigma factor [Amycolatopsis acididurans]
MSVTADEQVWALVTEARTGDRAAIGRLYELHMRDIFGFVYARLGDRHLAEDITSETFVRALRRMGSLSHRRSTFAAWLITIARNLVLDEMKSARHRREVAMPENFDAPGESGDISELIWRRQAAQEALRRLATLTPDQRTCLELRYLRGLSVAEVAHEMRKPSGAVRAVQLRALRRLRELIPPAMLEAPAGGAGGAASDGP